MFTLHQAEVTHIRCNSRPCGLRNLSRSDSTPCDWEDGRMRPRSAVVVFVSLQPCCNEEEKQDCQVGGQHRSQPGGSAAARLLLTPPPPPSFALQPAMLIKAWKCKVTASTLKVLSLQGPRRSLPPSAVCLDWKQTRRRRQTTVTPGTCPTLDDIRRDSNNGLLI